MLALSDDNRTQKCLLITKSIGTPFQLIELRCSNHFPAHRCKKDIPRLRARSVEDEEGAEITNGPFKFVWLSECTQTMEWVLMAEL